MENFEQSLQELIQLQSSDQLHKYYATMCAQLAEIRHDNRQQQLATRKKRQELDEERAQLDDLALSLQNVNYERMHVLQEIKTCELYASTYQSIPLVDVEEFKQHAPQELQVSAEDDAHQLQLNRLLYELQQREELNKQVSALRVQRSQLVVKRQKRRDELKKLDAMIVEHHQQAKQLAKTLGVVEEAS